MGKGLWYKLARADGWDWYTGKTVNYREAIGQVISCDDYQATTRCGQGIHMARNPNDCFVGAKFPSSAYLIEPTDGLIVIDKQKSKARAVRVVEEIPDISGLLGWDYTGLCQFLEALPTIPYFKPDGEPLEAWRLFLAPAWAAARDAARAAAWAAARDAAWDAAGAAARAAARDAAWAVARAAARDAAWAAARDAAGAAAWAAALMGAVFVYRGLKGFEPHRQHAVDRWQVWEKGYGLLCDVNRALYVYGVER